MSAPVLVSLASHVFSILGRLGARRPLVAIQRLWARAVIRVLGVDAAVSGLEHLPPGPVVLLPLHEGLFDAVLVLSLGRRTTFIARDELFGWRTLGRVLRSGGHVVLPTSPSVASLRVLRHECMHALQSGSDLVVFPQGSILGVEVAFAGGAKRLARAARVPIVPIVITGTHRVWEHPYTNRLRFSQSVRMDVLRPYSWDDLDWDQLEREMKERALKPDRPPARRYVPSRDGFWDGYDFEIDSAFPGVAAEIAEHRSRSQRRLQGHGITGTDQEAPIV